MCVQKSFVDKQCVPLAFPGVVFMLSIGSVALILAVAVRMVRSVALLLPASASVPDNPPYSLSGDRSLGIGQMELWGRGRGGVGK